MSRVIAVANHKGGIGKTTSTLTIGAVLATRGVRVLLVDFDPQGSLSISSGLEPDELPETIYTLMRRFVHDYTVPDLGVALHSIRPNLDLLPANIDLAAAEREFVSAKRSDYILQRLLAPTADAYDLTLIDCPPSLGYLTTAALTAASGVVIPLTPQFLPARGLAKLADVIGEVQRSELNPSLNLTGVIFTMVRPEVKRSAAMKQTIVDYLGGHVPILGEVHVDARVDHASEAGRPITEYAPHTEVARAYTEVADHLAAALGLAQPQEAL